LPVNCENNKMNSIESQPNNSNLNSAQPEENSTPSYESSLSTEEQMTDDYEKLSKQQNLDNNVDKSRVLDFVDLYSNLEKAIKESDVSKEEKRQWLYEYLELDINKIVKQLDEAKKEIGSEDPVKQLEKISEELTKIEQENIKKLDNLPESVQQAAIEYYQGFNNFFLHKQLRLRNWTDPENQLAMGMYMKHDLTELFGSNSLNSSLVAFSFFESSNLEIKEIFLRYKTKSNLEERRENERLDVDELLKGNTIDIRQREAEEILLGDLHKIFVKNARFEIKKERKPLSFDSLVNRLGNQIATGMFNTGSINFLGGTYQKITGGDEISQHMRIVSRMKFESPTPGLTEGGFTNFEQEIESPKLDSMNKLMTDFKRREVSLLELSTTSNTIIQELAKGDLDAFSKAASNLKNSDLAELGNEGNRLMFIIQEYYQIWQQNLFQANGQLRPSIFSISNEGDVGLGDLYMKRAWKTVSPNAEEDEIVVYEAIAKMMAIAMGDLTAELSNMLPPMDFQSKDAEGHLANIKNKVTVARNNAGSGQENKAAADALFDYLAEVRPELKPVIYDEFARALLMQTNPILQVYLWLDTAHEYKINDLIFGGAYNLTEADIKETGFNGLAKKVRRSFFGATDVLTQPLDILGQYKAEQETFYFGMTDDILKRRLDGKFPLAYRLNHFSPLIGISELNGWRYDMFDHKSFIDWCLKQKPDPNKPSMIEQLNNGQQLGPEQLREIIDKAFQVGDQFAYILINYFENKPGFQKYLIGDSYRTGNSKEKQTVAQAQISYMRRYLYSLVYEYTPTVFVARNDFTRFIHQHDKEFMKEWQKDIYEKLIDTSSDEGELMRQLIPSDTNITLTATTVEAREIQKQMIMAHEIENLFLEGVMAFQSYVLYVRNENSLNTDNRLSLRQFLELLVEESQKDPKNRSEHYQGAMSFINTLKKEYRIEADTDDLVNLFATNLYRNFYGAKSLSPDSLCRPVSINNQNNPKKIAEQYLKLNTALKKINRGLTNQLSYYNIGAEGKKERQKKVDLFDFLHDLTTSKQKISGSLFNLYKCNFGIKEFIVFNPEHTGADSSGKSIPGRMIHDLGTKLEGQKELVEALKELKKAVTATTSEELDEAEDNFLTKVFDGASKFESVGSEQNRHEICSHLIAQWIMMVKPPGDLRFLDALSLRKFMDSGKSLAELAFPDQGLLHSHSAGRADYIRLRNFLYKAHKKGLLPMGVEGKDPVRAQVKDVYFKKQFSYFENKLKEMEEKVVQLPKGKKLKFKDRVLYSAYQKINNFGTWNLNQVIYNEKYPHNLKRLYEFTGIGGLKDTVQFSLYGGLFLIFLLVMAFKEGMDSLNKQG
jgi:hypothetical protein